MQVFVEYMKKIGKAGLTIPVKLKRFLLLLNFYYSMMQDNNADVRL